MISEYSPKEDVFKQIKEDNDWCSERVPGLTKKFMKTLKSNAVPPGRVLGKSRYTTPNGNVVHLFVVKKQEGRYCRIAIVPLYEYEYGKLTRYAFPIYNKHNYVEWVLVFSSHCVDRMRERAGMDIFDTISYLCERHMAVVLKSYTYNGSSTEYIGAFGRGVIIADIHPWGAIAKTYLDRGIEHAHQMQDEYDTKVEAEKIADQADKESQEYVQTNSWFVKRCPRYVKV